MRHLVTVAVCRTVTPTMSCPKTPRRTDAASVLTLQGTSAGHVYGFTAMTGFAMTARAAEIDEHVAIDADVCRERRWLGCADVLYASRTRSPAEAVSWLSSTTAAYPGCRLAAAPLVGRGWAVLDSASRRAVFVAFRVPGDEPLVASCLHAWLVTGRVIRGLQNIRSMHRA